MALIVGPGAQGGQARGRIGSTTLSHGPTFPPGTAGARSTALPPRPRALNLAETASRTFIAYYSRAFRDLDDATRAYWTAQARRRDANSASALWMANARACLNARYGPEPDAVGMPTTDPDPPQYVTFVDGYRDGHLIRGSVRRYAETFSYAGALTWAITSGAKTEYCPATILVFTPPAAFGAPPAPLQITTTFAFPCPSDLLDVAFTLTTTSLYPGPLPPPTDDTWIDIPAPPP